MSYETHYSPDRQQRLVIEYEGDPQNPREDSEPVTRMWCQHSRYLLGDQDSPKTDLVEAIEKLAAAQGVNFEDEYVDCPQSKEAHHDVAHCDHCDVDGDVENPDFNDLEDSRQISIGLERVDPDEEHIFRLPLYLYDHSGITMNTGGFSCPWDSGCVGMIFITREKVIEEGMWGATADMPVEELRQLGHKAMQGDVETYDQYLRGDVYGFRLEKLMPKPNDWDAEEWAEVDEHWEETDSCRGFYGSDVEESGMREHTGLSEEEFAEWRAA